MSPLQAIAMGFVVVALDTLGIVDLLPDPLGWLLVLYGVWRLGLPQRTALLVTAVIALVLSAVLWMPDPAVALRDADLALRWATSLPDLAFIMLLSHALWLAARGEDPPDRGFSWRWKFTLWGALVVALLPPVLDAAGGTSGGATASLLQVADFCFVLLWLWLIWNLFASHSKPYATPRDSH